MFKYGQCDDLAYIFLLQKMYDRSKIRMCVLFLNGVIIVLQDLDRKLLRLLFNFSRQKHRMPMWVELEYKMRLNKSQIIVGLRRLVEQQYIFWPDNPDLSTMVILEVEDRDNAIRKKTSMTSKPKQYNGSNLDYWTKY